MPSNEFRKLRKNPPAEWEPIEIIYSRYTYTASGSSIEFSAQPSSCVVPSRDIERFIDRLRRGEAPDCSETLTPEDAGMSNATPLDIWVRERCYVVVELDPDRDWQFRRRDVALTAKADYEHDNCGLRHVLPDGSRTPDGPGVEGCRIIYFAVVRREAKERQSFNFHVELRQGGTGWLELAIDPDVPNTGSGFPLFG